MERGHGKKFVCQDVGLKTENAPKSRPPVLALIREDTGLQITILRADSGRRLVLFPIPGNGLIKPGIQTHPRLKSQHLAGLLDAGQ